MSTITKTIRLPTAMVERAEAEANQLGLTFNDIVEVSLAVHLGLPADRSFELLAAIREYLLTAYPTLQGFPQDVTLEVFRRIRANEHLWAHYLAATSDPGGQFDAAARDALHRKIGKAVKSVLNATVIGRSLPLDPDKELIRSHALLVPDTQADRKEAP